MPQYLNWLAKRTLTGGKSKGKKFWMANVYYLDYVSWDSFSFFTKVALKINCEDIKRNIWFCLIPWSCFCLFAGNIAALFMLEVHSTFLEIQKEIEEKKIYFRAPTQKNHMKQNLSGNLKRCSLKGTASAFCCAPSAVHLTSATHAHLFFRLPRSPAVPSKWKLSSLNKNQADVDYLQTSLYFSGRIKNIRGWRDV